MSRRSFPRPFASTLVLSLLAMGCGKALEPAMDTTRVTASPDASEGREAERSVAPASSPAPVPAGGEVAALEDLAVAAEPAVATERREVARRRKDSGAVANRQQIARPRPVEPMPTTNPSGEKYRDYGLNGFTDADEDRLSTFAVDVDTASYTLARRHLQTGYLPANASVRVEEFVNYFPYVYEPPLDGDPFSVDVEAMPSPWDERVKLVRVGLQGRKVPVDQRKPVHLTFLVDVSGSMRSADKLDLVKHSLKMLTEELEDGDTVAVATYAGAEKIVLEPTPISKSDRIMRSLDGLTAGGGTAMASGMDLAYELADRTFVPGDVNRVIVCSDGDANIGRANPEQISGRLKEYAKKGITLTTLGFGTGNTNDVMMERLANDGDGNYFYIDGEREARRVLVDKLGSTLEVIAKDVKVQIEWNPEVVSDYRLVGYENRDVADHDFRNDAVDAGEIGAGHQVTALYEVHLSDGGDGDLAMVRLRAKAPGPDAPAVERAWAVPRGVVRGSFEEASAHSRVAASAGFFADKLRGSPWMAEVSFAQIAELARGAARVEYEEDRELVQLIERASQLSGESAVVRR